MKEGQRYSQVVEGKPVQWTVAEVLGFASDKRDPDRSTEHWCEVEVTIQGGWTTFVVVQRPCIRGFVGS